MSETSNNLDNRLTSKIRDSPYLIGISGGSGGGKTSVANVLYKCLGIENCLLFSMDTYYKSELADKIHEGKYGVQYLDYKVLADILEQTEPNLIK